MPTTRIVLVKKSAFEKLFKDKDVEFEDTIKFQLADGRTKATVYHLQGPFVSTSDVALDSITPSVERPLAKGDPTDPLYCEFSATIVDTKYPFTARTVGAFFGAE